MVTADTTGVKIAILVGNLVALKQVVIVSFLEEVANPLLLVLMVQDILGVSHTHVAISSCLVLIHSECSGLYFKLHVVVFLYSLEFFESTVMAVEDVPNGQIVPWDVEQDSDHLSAELVVVARKDDEEDYDDDAGDEGDEPNQELGH